MKKLFSKLLASFLIVVLILSGTFSCLIGGNFGDSNLPLLKGNRFSITADAASTGNLDYELNNDGATYYVSKCSESASGTLTIPAKYNGKPVTRIGVSAFFNCNKLVSVIIPKGVTEIASEAFSYCKNLTSISIPDTVTSIGSYAFINTGLINDNANWENNVFYLDKYLISVTGNKFEDDSASSNVCTIRQGTVCIADAAFAKRAGLKSIIIPNTVKHIGSHAFSSCSGMTSMIIPDSVETIGSYAFSSCSDLSALDISAGVKSIGIRAFSDCPLLNSITVSPENQYFSVADGVLFNKNKTAIIKYPCPKEGNFVFPDSVTNIAEAAFYNCDKLSSVTLSKNLKEIPTQAFYGCSKLTAVVISEGVTKISYEAFNYCSGLKEISLPDSVTSIGISAFDHTSYSKNSRNWTNNVLYIGKYLISANINKIKGAYTVKPETLCIADSAFYYAEKLQSVVLPKTVTHIGNNAFMSCPALSEITIPNSLKFIGDFAFCGCIKLTSVFIPKSVTYIGDTALGYRNPGIKVSGFKIFGYSGSTADTYCKSNKITLVSSKPGSTELKSASNTSGGIRINWLPAKNAAGYYVYKKTSKGWNRIAAISGGNTQSYTDKSAKSGSTGKYTVKAYNPFGNGTYSSKGISKYYLSQPSVTVKNISGGITISWGKVTGAKGYYVYRKAGSEKSWSRIATINKNGTVSYTDKKIKSGTNYKYTVKAFNGKTYSSYTSGVAIKYLAPTVIKSASSGKSGITLKYNKVSAGTGYVIYRKTTGSWSKIATVSGNTKTTYIDKTAKKGTTYTYTVRAYNGNFQSANSNKKACKR